MANASQPEVVRDVPQYQRFFNPVLHGLRSLGGSGSIQEIDEKVIQTMNFGEEALAKLHNPEQGNETEIEYRPAWARTYLKTVGLIDNSSRGIWSLTKDAENIMEVDPAEVVRRVRESFRRKADDGEIEEDEIEGESRKARSLGTSLGDRRSIGC